jgi:hypothetical protein
MSTEVLEGVTYSLSEVKSGHSPSGVGQGFPSGSVQSASLSAFRSTGVELHNKLMQASIKGWHRTSNDVTEQALERLQNK